MSKNPRDDFQKKSKQQQTEAADEEPGHPRPAIAFGDQREKQGDKPHE